MTNTACTLRFTTFICIFLVALYGCDDKKQTKNSASSNHSLTAARSYLNQNQYRAAIIEARNALKNNPSDEAAELYAEIFIAIGQPRLSSDFIEQYGAKSLKLSQLWVQSLIDQKKYVSAKNTLSNFNSESLPALTLGLFNAQIAAGSNDLDKANTLLRALREEHPQSQEAKILHLKIATLRGDSQTAAQVINALDLPNNENPEAFITLAQISASQDNYNLAEQNLMTALRYLPDADIMTPDKSTTLLLLIETLTNQGRYSDAVPYSQLLAKANPDWQKSKEQLERAVNHLQNGKLDSAEVIFTEMQKAKTNTSQTNAMLGLINLQKGNTEQAADLLTNSIDPEVSPSLLTSAAAIALLKTDEYENAVEILTKALEVNPKDTRLLTLYGLALTQKPESQTKGLEVLQNAVSLSPNNSKSYIALAEGLYAVNRFEKGKDALLKAYQLSSNDETVAAHVAGQLVSAKQEAQAVAFVRSLVKDNTTKARNWIIKGITEARLKNYSAAEQSFDTAIARDKNSFDAHFYKAYVATIGKKWKIAEKHYRAAININALSIAAYAGLFNTKFFEKDAQQAIATLDKLAEQEKYALGANLVLANYHQAQGNNAQAQSTFARINFMEAKETPAITAPAVESIYTNIAINKTASHIKENQKTEAIKTLESALTHYPENITLLRFAATSYISLEELADAATIASKLKLLNEENFSTLIEVDILVAQNDLKPALTLVKNQWKKNPNIGLGQAILGISSKLNEKVDASILSQWKQAFPASDTPYLYTATQYLKDGNGEAAIVQYKSLLKFQPQNIQALNNLAWLYMEKDNAKQALKYADQVYQLAPENPLILDTVGWVKTEANLKEGLAILEKAAKLAPDNADIQAHLKQAQDKF